MRQLLLCAVLVLGLTVTVLAQDEAPTCDYCGGPWDTATRVFAVIEVEGESGLYHFDSPWHFFEYLVHFKADGTEHTLTLAAAEVYDDSDGPSQWVVLHSGADLGEPVFVWTETQFPGARKAPFVAVFEDREDAAEFQAQFGGDLIGHEEVHARFQARWDASHGPGGEEKHAH